MKILILGMDGYLGWPTALRMTSLGHKVVGMDNYSKRHQLKKNNLTQTFNIQSMEKRIERIKNLKFVKGSVANKNQITDLVKKTKPDVIFNFAHIPSAPYSMSNIENCLETWRNNTEGQLILLWAMKEYAPKAHLIKLGTMGEYGTPNVPIPEGFFEYRIGKLKDKMLFPRKAGSFYHQTKVANTHNIEFACRIWGLKVTDIMQGIIYGTRTPEIEKYNSKTNFYFDETFGTVINRMLASVIVNHPLPVYGKGNMVRGILSLTDAIDCYELIVNNPPKQGEDLIINQFDESKSIVSMAKDVIDVAKSEGYDSKIKFYKDPRIEKEKHAYEPETKWLKKHGYKRNHLFKESVKIMLEDLKDSKNIIKKYNHTIAPKTQWK